MDSDLFAPPHSCDFCQKLIFYKRDKDWWENAVSSTSTVLEDVPALLGDRVKKWLTEQLNGVTRHDFDSLISSLRSKCIFDCTVAEARNAAASGCGFCEHVIGCGRDDSLVQTSQHDASFLAASWTSWVHFGVIHRTVREPYFRKTKSGESEKEAEFAINVYGGRQFELIALPGTYLNLEQKNISMYLKCPIDCKELI
jgi:hypothetical protein